MVFLNLIKKNKMAEKEAKQVIVWRHDLNKIRKGKCMAQAAHASWGAGLSIAERSGNKITIDLSDHYVKMWFEQRFKKIVVSCENEKELVEIYNKAKKAGLPCALITDAGLTEFNGVPTKTCVGIGPADPDEIDKITGELKPY